MPLNYKNDDKPDYRVWQNESFLSAFLYIGGRLIGGNLVAEEGWSKFHTINDLILILFNNKVFNKYNKIRE